MTKSTVETPAQDTRAPMHPIANSQPSRVTIDPVAAAGEYAALNEFYRNRNLLLANEISSLRAQNDALIAELAKRDATPSTIEQEQD